MPFILIITSDYSDIYLQGLITGCGIQQLAFLLLYPLFAGSVATAATKTYGTLRTIQITKSKFFNKRINQQVTKYIVFSPNALIQLIVKLFDR